MYNRKAKQGDVFVIAGGLVRIRVLETGRNVRLGFVADRSVAIEHDKAAETISMEDYVAPTGPLDRYRKRAS